MHTPGPWRAETWESGHSRIRAGTDDVFVADINNGLNGQTGANARLIAAAPDMLAALRDLLKWEAHMGGFHSLAWENARAAIAKAEGRK